MASFLKTVGWFLVFAGIFVGSVLFFKLVDFAWLGQASRNVADPLNAFAQFGYNIAQVAFFTGLTISVGSLLALAIPGLILMGIGEVISAIEQSREATVGVLYRLAATQSAGNQIAATVQPHP